MNAAKLRPAWVRGGHVGTLLLGTLFATATAIWITVLGVALLPWPLSWLRGRSSPTP